MTDLDRLLALEEIKSLRARYCRFVDEKDWHGLRALFSDDATFDTENGPGTVNGPDEFVDAARQHLEGAITVHHCHCPEIEFTSDTAANTIWSMEDRLLWPATDDTPRRSYHGMGHYRERCVKVDDVWKISHWCLTRIRVDAEGF